LADRLVLFEMTDFLIRSRETLRLRLGFKTYFEDASSQLYFQNLNIPRLLRTGLRPQYPPFFHRFGFFRYSLHLTSTFEVDYYCLPDERKISLPRRFFPTPHRAWHSPLFCSDLLFCISLLKSLKSLVTLHPAPYIPFPITVELILTFHSSFLSL